MPNREILIAGPCANESDQQMLQVAETLQQLGIRIIRGPIIKPRTTSGGFDGRGETGIPVLRQIAQMGLIPATEVMLPSDAHAVVDGLNQNESNPCILWLGARNQNHKIQREVGEIAHSHGDITVMLKNFLSPNEANWLGAVSHVLGSGLPTEKLWLCFRGIDPSGHENPNNWRNLPWFDWAMKVKEKSGLPMIYDPSHIGGSRENVFKAVEIAQQYDFDGIMVEVHPDPPNALTDQCQQLNFEQFEQLLLQIKQPELVSI